MMVVQRHILDSSVEVSQRCTLLLQGRRVCQGTKTTFFVGYRELPGAAMELTISNGHDLDEEPTELLLLSTKDWVD